MTSKDGAPRPPRKPAGKASKGGKAARAATGAKRAKAAKAAKKAKAARSTRAKKLAVAAPAPQAQPLAEPRRAAPEPRAQPLAEPRRAAPAPAPVRAPPVLDEALSSEVALLDATRSLLAVEARSPYDLEVLARARRTISEHQALCARRMEKILNGQNITLQDIKLPQEDDAAEPPLMRLRRFLDALQAARQRLDTPSYGRCEVCGGFIAGEALVSMPWATRCQACGGADPRLSAPDAPT